MVRSFIAGVIIALIISIIGIAIKFSVSQIFFIVSLVIIILAVLVSGFGVSGDRIRANTSNETKEDRNWRINFSRNLIILSIPSIIGFIVSRYLL
ncbi:DUF5316 domain-containing protein [Bacillus ginsengihumi]|uniref:DUF5316 domain-containing protein n=1 Tax=Heyndrickxia ginsengihumi TaxID=363870 RepID=A0A6M0PC99_9BACI|nr:DUF5316 family protein [Heyndrickxia ginsengihumi]NEY21730.1 DUF5316 domain-containing protein [Heyndrickxia ginsengihumi]